MDYMIDIDKIRPLIHEEVSRIAASAYSEDGTPLYDQIHIIDRDDDTIYRHINDAVDHIIMRMTDIAHICEEGEVIFRDGQVTTLPKIFFDAPDMDPHNEEAVIRELDRYISLDVVSAWVQNHYQPMMEEYARRSQAALSNVVRYLKTRRTPRRNMQ